MTKEQSKLVVGKSYLQLSDESVYIRWGKTIDHLFGDGNEDLPTIEEYCKYIQDIV